MPIPPSPRAPASPVLTSRTPTLTPIHVVSPSAPSPTLPMSSTSPYPAVQGYGRLGQSPAPIATLTSTVVPTPEPNLESKPETSPILSQPMGDGIGEGPTMSLGLFFACALESDGKPLCWNFTEDLDQDVPSYDGPLSLPPEGEIFVSITSSAFHSCGLREDGTPVCWRVIDDPELSSLSPPPQGNGSRQSTAGDATPVASVPMGLPCVGPRSSAGRRAETMNSPNRPPGRNSSP